MDDEIFLTEEGIQKLRSELDYLINHERPDLAARLKAAIEMGDLSENADYIKAKEDQGFIEGNIQELEDILKRAKAIKKESNSNGIIQIGSTVLVQEENYPKETIMIVGSKEADPKSGKLSYESPIGNAILGHKVGDIVRIKTPSGSVNFKIIEIK